MALFDNIFSGLDGLANTLLDTLGTGAVYVKVVQSGVKDLRNDIVKKTVTRTSVIVSPPIKYTTYELANSDIVKEDCKIVGKGTDFTDVTNNIDRIEINGKVFTIISHKRAYSGELVATVELQVREVV